MTSARSLSGNNIPSLTLPAFPRKAFSIQANAPPWLRHSLLTVGDRSWPGPLAPGDPQAPPFHCSPTRHVPLTSTPSPSYPRVFASSKACGLHVAGPSCSMWSQGPILLIYPAPQSPPLPGRPPWAHLSLTDLSAASLERRPPEDTGGGSGLPCF